MHRNYFILYFFITHFALIFDVNFSSSIQNFFSQLSNAKNVTNHNHSQEVYLGPYSNLWPSLFTKRNYLVLIAKDSIIRSSPPKVFLAKGILKTPSKFTEKHPCWSAISINCFTLWKECSPEICCMLSDHLFVKTTMKGCFSILDFWQGPIYVSASIIS